MMQGLLFNRLYIIVLARLLILLVSNVSILQERDFRLHGDKPERIGGAFDGREPVFPQCQLTSHFAFRARLSSCRDYKSLYEQRLCSMVGAYGCWNLRRQ
ncbi:hypothetical protein V5799_010083 [Amblyomma americanum]|uniref:Uncharacterized protein n=1 Tax=Amblyomma americanum TaxID=6943 RepID=A0AAQ4F9R8_AMBAM